MNTADQKTPDISETLGLHPAGARRRLITKIVGGVLVVAIVVAAIVLYRAKSRAARAVHYETQEVTLGELVATVSATGTLEPVNQVEVGSEVSGTMKSVEVDYNDRVTVGQVLARIDTSKLEAQALQSESALEAARAKVLEVEATVQEAEAQLARLKQVRDLSGGKVPSLYELEGQQATVARARAGVASAKAQVSQAQATLNLNRSDLGKAVIHSPVNGMVLTRAIEPGQTVAASFTAPVLFTLAEDLSQLELHVDVDEADVGQVREGQEATFTVDAYPDKHFPARITQVRFGSTTTAGVVTYTTVLKVNNDDLTLRPGMTATAVITTKKLENARLIPNAALRFQPPEAPVAATNTKRSLISSLIPRPPRQNHNAQSNGTASTGKEQKVYVLKNEALQAVPVVTEMTDGRRTAIAEGALEPGMPVVTGVTTGAQ